VATWTWQKGLKGGEKRDSYEDHWALGEFGWIIGAIEV
jgi:hypothetical protein